MHKQQIQAAERSERVGWYRDLVEEMTGMVPVVRATTVPVLIDGKFWQVPWVVASVPAALVPGCGWDGVVKEGGQTEAEALRALCERVHAATWAEQNAQTEAFLVEPVALARGW